MCSSRRTAARSSGPRRGLCNAITRRRPLTAPAPRVQATGTHRRVLNLFFGGRGPTVAGQNCTMCGDSILPGENVAFQRGDLIHLACYEQRLARVEEHSDNDDAR